MSYNGIAEPSEWPPRNLVPTSREPGPVPYLEQPPAVIPIDVGRQLLVDEFLIADSSLRREFHVPVLHEASPVLVPETPLEMNFGLCPVACPFKDGCFYDPADGLFKLWYHAGWFDGVALATSRDGIHWERPELDVEPGTNRVLPLRPQLQRDGVGVWLDLETDRAAERFKMFAYHRQRGAAFRYGELGGPNTPTDRAGGHVYSSPDGIHWTERAATGPGGDNTTIFYNPFRKRWVYSVRTSDRAVGRRRGYREHSDLFAGAAWQREDVAHWAGADHLDPPSREFGYPTQLYNIDAVGYESILLGFLMIHRGPPNEICDESARSLRDTEDHENGAWGSARWPPFSDQGSFPKITELLVGYSRDGFHFDRRDRTPIVAGTHRPGDWNRDYIHSCGGCCLIVGDRLHIYFGAFSGVSPKLGTHMYAGGSTGLATLRRDGFVSHAAGSKGGTLTTRPLRFSGSHLFVNAAAAGGELRAEVLDAAGNPIAPFSRAQCVPVSGDATQQAVTWGNDGNLERVAGQPVRLRFHLRSAALYAFWVSPDRSGASHGYVAAAGPGFTAATDTVGQGAGSRRGAPRSATARPPPGARRPGRVGGVVVAVADVEAAEVFGMRSAQRFDDRLGCGPRTLGQQHGPAERAGRRCASLPAGLATRPSARPSIESGASTSGASCPGASPG